MKDRKNSSLLGRLDKFQRLFFVALLSVLAVGAVSYTHLDVYKRQALSILPREL